MQENNEIRDRKSTCKRERTFSAFARTQSRCALFFGDTEVGAKILSFFDSTGYSIVITLITFITLYSDDVRQAFFKADSDLGFSILTLVCMAFYVIEMIALSLLKENYFGRFYFWLDLISTLTMILDLVWINDLLSGGNGIQAATSIAKIARASRVSKIGARSTKLIRIIRLIRILRLYKTASNRLNKQNEQKLAGIEAKQIRKGLDQMTRKGSKRLEHLRRTSGTIFQKNGLQKQVSCMMKVDEEIQFKKGSLRNIIVTGSQRKLSVLNPHFQAIKVKGDNQTQKKIQHHQPHGHTEDHIVSEDGHLKQEDYDLQVPAQTKVGSKLKEEIQKNIISMILLILISIPILNGDTWFDNTTAYAESGQNISFMKNEGEFDNYVGNFISQSLDLASPLLYFEVKVNQTCCQFPRDYPSYNIPEITLYRTQEVDIQLNSYEDTFMYDKSQRNILSAKLSIGRTTFVCVLLVIATLLFSRDVQEHALQPLENMIDTVKRISSNPLQAIRDIEKEKMIKQVIEDEQSNGPVQTVQTEPTVLENMIIKIGSLLAVGFGEAGTELIARNIENYGSLNVMMPGKKAMCIFGFCDIRNFTDATEVLEANVMVFVNEIAQICHEIVNRVGGNPNKNIGDAFLLVWKFGEEDIIMIQNRDETVLELRKSLKVQQTADLAVYSFVKMVAEIARSHVLQKYKNNPKLKERIKNYQGVKMGYGLHVGWSIEGPIGSEFKIDTSYLGPHVNMASRLEGATKAYGTPILISGDLYELMTLKNKEYLRQVDKVENKEQKALDLYTIDLSFDNLIKLYGVKEELKLNSFEKKKSRVFHNQQRDKLLENVDKKRMTGALWGQDREIKIMREPFTKYFFEEWKHGFENFQKGNWDQAYQSFKKTQILGLNNNDGPSTNLMQYMESLELTPPKDWNGVRQFCG